MPLFLCYLALSFTAPWAPPCGALPAYRRVGVLRAAESISSPFDSKGAAPTGSGGAKAAMDLTVDNVDTVLDEVRPYLISDGGNVAVVGVDADARIVSLQLQGACGSCPSSTTTMKMGIERVLKEQWPDLADVVEVGTGPTELDVGVAIEAIQEIMPAITGLGGSVRIASAETIDGRGKVVAEYTGPEKIKLGMELALRDHPLIDDVEFI
eukprot:CAMPEP_0115851536 /NCGR_PEP_ID=MMETSP0287-20121206/12532_1 /TAXON_ID=412157 /ORGANISM="Chrysochromulina rotalis, Strain UIO044" /LENGTH=209 /DNA_ID=CAMNT_0003305571 /DNA_START=8 /DNA_END=637 /DNA_ORIENTATION=+